MRLFVGVQHGMGQYLYIQSDYSYRKFSVGLEYAIRDA